MLEITWGCRLVSLTNAHEHWRHRQRRAKAQREAAHLLLISEISKHGQPQLPAVVTITRYGKRKLDDDNLAASAKHVRDGVADALQVDDGDGQMVRWEYRQEIGQAYGVRIQVEGHEDRA